MARKEKVTIAVLLLLVVLLATALAVLLVPKSRMHQLTSLEPSSARALRAERDSLIQRSQEVVKSMLLDPESALFRDVYLNRDPELFGSVCGWVNAKNSFGGYVGFSRFISTGYKYSTIFDDETKPNFEAKWKERCVDTDSVMVRLDSLRARGF